MMSTISEIEKLPVEIIAMIVDQLDIADILKMRLVNRYLNRLVNNTVRILRSSSQRLMKSEDFLLIFPRLVEVDFNIKMMIFDDTKNKSLLHRLNRFAIYSEFYNKLPLKDQHIRYYDDSDDEFDDFPADYNNYNRHKQLPSDNYYEINMIEKTCYITDSTPEPFKVIFKILPLMDEINLYLGYREMINLIRPLLLWSAVKRFNCRYNVVYREQYLAQIENLIENIKPKNVYTNVTEFFVIPYRMISKIRHHFPSLKSISLSLWSIGQLEEDYLRDYDSINIYVDTILERYTKHKLVSGKLGSKIKFVEDKSKID